MQFVGVIWRSQRYDYFCLHKDSVQLKTCHLYANHGGTRFQNNSISPVIGKRWIMPERTKQSPSKADDNPVILKLLSSATAFTHRGRSYLLVMLKPNFAPPSLNPVCLDKLNSYTMSSRLSLRLTSANTWGVSVEKMAGRIHPHFFFFFSLHPFPASME